MAKIPKRHLLFGILSSTTRLRVLREIFKSGSITSGELQESLNLKQDVVAHCMHMLLKLKIVESKRTKNKATYSIKDNELVTLVLLLQDKYETKLKYDL